MAQANLSYLIRPYHKSKGKGRAGVNEGGGGEPAVGNSLRSPPTQGNLHPGSTGTQNVHN